MAAGQVHVGKHHIAAAHGKAHGFLFALTIQGNAAHNTFDQKRQHGLAFPFFIQDLPFLQRYRLGYRLQLIQQFFGMDPKVFPVELPDINIQCFLHACFSPSDISFLSLRIRGTQPARNLLAVLPPPPINNMHSCFLRFCL